MMKVAFSIRRIEKRTLRIVKNSFIESIAL